MAQVKIGDAHGLYRIFVGAVSADGYNIGQNAGTELPAAGTLCVPYMMRYAKSAEFSIEDRTTIDFTGGDVWTGSYVYGITSIGSTSITSSTVEADLIALLSASDVDETTNTRMAAFAENVLLPVPPQVFVHVVWRLQSKEPGSVGAAKYFNLILPRVWVAPAGPTGGPSFQSAAEYNFNVTMTVADRFPFGLLFSGSGMSLQENQTPNVHIITENPMHIVGFVAEAGASETVTLPYKPIDFDYTTPDSSTQPVQCYVDGVQVDATSINKDTGAIVITDTFTGGEYIGIFYETNYEPTA